MTESGRPPCHFDRPWRPAGLLIAAALAIFALLAADSKIRPVFIEYDRHNLVPALGITDNPLLAPGTLTDQDVFALGTETPPFEDTIGPIETPGSPGGGNTTDSTTDPAK